MHNEMCALGPVRSHECKQLQDFPRHSQLVVCSIFSASTSLITPAAAAEHEQHLEMSSPNALMTLRILASAPSAPAIMVRPHALPLKSSAYPSGRAPVANAASEERMQRRESGGAKTASREWASRADMMASWARQRV